jgi:hypothetical protein
VRRRTRLSIATALAAALLLPTAATAAPDRCADAPQSDFADREQAREVHRASIDCVDHTGIARGREANGQRLYAPLEEVTRAQMASFIIQTLEAAGYEDELPSGEATEEDPDEFDDIAGSVHRERINQLARIGVANGVGDGTRYAPGRNITRQQMASFIVAATEFALVADFEAQGSHFSDVGARNVHFDNINAGFEEGLFSGTTPPRRGVPNSGRFSPARNVLRDQMASFLTNLLDRIER